MSIHAARTNMIKQQLRTGDVLSEPLLELFELLPRHEFVPAGYQEFAYSDMQIPLGHGERMMTPLEEGQLLQSLNLQGHETVLEVGTGSGYLTALLAGLSQKVISIEIHADLHQRAQQNLAQFNIDNVELICGDGCNGWLDKAPYDVVVLTGGLDKITDTHKLQVLPGGALFVILGSSPVMQAKLMRLDHDNQWSEREVFETDLPLLIDKTRPKTFVF